MGKWQTSVANQMLINKRTISTKFWRGKRVFITGHTGFKGSWLTFWLLSMGANITGYSLEPNTNPSIFNILGLEKLITHNIGNICNYSSLEKALRKAKPEIILHLAAQPIVSEGYEDPIGTFETNIMGVVNLLEICRHISGINSILIVSSDKCYQNFDTGTSFKISDPLGGDDPYSASKAGTEIIVGSYLKSYFNKKDSPVLASARAGNVVGGGDWSKNRLLPDAARAFSENLPLKLRNPIATRPWQHVIEPLYGYMILIQAMHASHKFSGPWNFGPSDRNHETVGNIAKKFANFWSGNAEVLLSKEQQDWKEAKTLDLDCIETNRLLGWKPVLDLNNTLSLTADWYCKNLNTKSKHAMKQLTLKQINNYVENYAHNT